MSASTTVYVPRGTNHGFKNASPTRGRLVDYHFPGGFEAFFEEAGVEVADDSQPPSLPSPDMEELVALFKRHGMDVSR